MARKAAWQDMADADLGPYGKSRGTRWGRVFALLFCVLVATFVGAYYLPLYRAHQKLADQYRELGQRSQGLAETVNKVQGELKTLSESREQLQAEHDAREGEKKLVGDQQDRVRATLSTKLDKFIKKGNAAVLVSAGSLVVAFDSGALFVPQKLDLTPAARALLCDIVKTSEAKTLTVRTSLAAASVVPAPLSGGDAGPWASSAGRAAAVAQVLEQQCAVPRAQLSAASTGSQQPRPGLKLTGDPLELELGLSAR